MQARSRSRGEVVRQAQRRRDTDRRYREYASPAVRSFRCTKTARNNEPPVRAHTATARWQVPPPTRRVGVLPTSFAWVGSYSGNGWGGAAVLAGVARDGARG